MDNNEIKDFSSMYNNVSLEEEYTSFSQDVAHHMSVIKSNCAYTATDWLIATLVHCVLFLTKVIILKKVNK